MKNKSIIILIVVICLVLVGAYVLYSQNSSVPNLPLQQADSTGSSNSSDSIKPSAPGSDKSAIDDTNSNSENIDNEATPDNDTAQDEPEQDKFFIPDFTLEDIDGNKVSLSDYKDKIVILNFWAEWCRFCLEEMPDFNQLNKELENDDEVEILTVNVGDSVETATKYLTSNNIDLKVLMDLDASVYQMYGLTGLPKTIFVNKDGSLYAYIPGKTDKETLDKVLDMAKSGAPLR
jgi:peroxiredoxin